MFYQEYLSILLYDLYNYLKRAVSKIKWMYYTYLNTLLKDKKKNLR